MMIFVMFLSVPNCTPGLGARDVLPPLAAVRHRRGADEGHREHVHRGRQDEGGRGADVDVAEQDPVAAARPDESDRRGVGQRAALVSEYGEIGMNHCTFGWKFNICVDFVYQLVSPRGGANLHKK